MNSIWLIVALGAFGVMCIIGAFMAPRMYADMKFRTKGLRTLVTILTCVGFAVAGAGFIYGSISVYNDDKESNAYDEAFRTVFLDAVTNSHVPADFVSKGNKMFLYNASSDWFSSSANSKLLYKARNSAMASVGSYIPAAYRAEAPEEAKLIVILTERRVASARYDSVGMSSGGATGYTLYYDFIIRDVETWEIVATNTFYGENPPKTVSGSAKEVLGAAPKSSPIYTWVKELAQEHLGADAQ